MKVRKRTWETGGKKKTAWQMTYTHPATGERKQETIKGLTGKEKKGEAEGRAKREPLPARVAVGEPEQAVALVDRVVKHRAGRDGTKDERKRRRAEDDAALVVRQGDRQLVSTTRLAALLVLLSAAAVVGVLLRALGLW